MSCCEAVFRWRARVGQGRPEWTEWWLCLRLTGEQLALHRSRGGSRVRFGVIWRWRRRPRDSDCALALRRRQRPRFDVEGVGDPEQNLEEGFERLLVLVDNLAWFKVVHFSLARWNESGPGRDPERDLVNRSQEVLDHLAPRCGIGLGAPLGGDVDDARFEDGFEDCEQEGRRCEAE